MTTYNKIQTELVNLKAQLEFLKYNPTKKTLTVNNIETDISDVNKLANLLQSEIDSKQSIIDYMFSKTKYRPIDDDTVVSTSYYVCIGTQEDYQTYKIRDIIGLSGMSKIVCKLSDVKVIIVETEVGLTQTYYPHEILGLIEYTNLR